MKKFYDIEIDSQVELENGKTLGKLEESKISVNDGNCGSGGWPADLPKPSVGGYGYTEQGEQTTIEWDGDTTGKEHFESEGAVLYNVANVPQDFDKDSVSKITETTGETDFAVLDMSEMAGVIAFSYNNSKMLLMVVVDYEKANAIFGDASLTTNGVFFAVNGDVYTTSLTYGTPDTIHKIDEKYLPGTQEKTEVIVTNIGNGQWEFDAETIPQNLDDYSNINFIVYYLAPTAVGHDYIYAVIPCATCTYQFDMISSISGLPFVNGSTMIVPRIVYSENTERYYGGVSEYTLQDIIK